MVYVSISAPKSPTPGTAAEFVQKHGIQALDGVPLIDGERTLYIHRRLIAQLVEEYADLDEQDRATAQMWRERCYGGSTPDADMVVWIKLNTVRLANPKQHIPT